MRVQKKRGNALVAACLAGVAAMGLLLHVLGAERPAEGPASEAAPPRTSILIELPEKTVYVLENGKPVASFPCAVGKPETPSPVGSFTISEKAHWGEGFGGYWIGLSCTWGNFGLHGTTHPESVGHAASHGCFRLDNADAAKLYDMVNEGDSVAVSGGIYGVFSNGLRAVSPGMYGADVVFVQRFLRQNGFYDGDLTGSLDAQTLLAFHRFEVSRGFPRTWSITPWHFEQMGVHLLE